MITEQDNDEDVPTGDEPTVVPPQSLRSAESNRKGKTVAVNP